MSALGHVRHLSVCSRPQHTWLHSSKGFPAWTYILLFFPVLVVPGADGGKDESGPCTPWQKLQKRCRSVLDVLATLLPSAPTHPNAISWQQSMSLAHYSMPAYMPHRPCLAEGLLLSQDGLVTFWAHV